MIRNDIYATPRRDTLAEIEDKVSHFSWSTSIIRRTFEIPKHIPAIQFERYIIEQKRLKDMP